MDVTNSAVEHINRKLYDFGNRTTVVKHAQLRMKCSWLSGHLYKVHVLDSPMSMWF